MKKQETSGAKHLISPISCSDSSDVVTETWLVNKQVILTHSTCATLYRRLLIDPAWFFSSVFSWSCTWFYYQFSFKSIEEWDNSAFVSWPGITWSWKSCEDMVMSELPRLHFVQAEVLSLSSGRCIQWTGLGNSLLEPKAIGLLSGIIMSPSRTKDRQTYYPL